MKLLRLLMGMPITVEVVDPQVSGEDIEKIFSYFAHVDQTFSTYKKDSEISRLNDGCLTEAQCSDDVREVLKLSEETKRITDGYFDIRESSGKIDPAGLVKGWAIRNAATMLERAGFENFYVEAGGDIQVRGRNSHGEIWRVGIRDPFMKDRIVKVVALDGLGIATSGTYIRGQHIRNPHAAGPITDIVSLTVIGPDVYEADRFATAAFAMGRKGIEFLEERPGLEGYMIDAAGTATMTSGFPSLTSSYAAPDR